MRPGPPPAPRRRVSRQFRHHYRAALASGYRSWALAFRAGFGQVTDLSNAIHADNVAATPLLVERLRSVAAQICFPPELVFEPESEHAEVGA